VIGYEGGKTDIYGLFNAIRPASYPHTQSKFSIFAQLAGGLREVPFFVDLVLRARNELTWTTEVRQLQFPDRDRVVQLALEIQGCVFPEPGPYLVELYCDNVCIADVPLQLLEGKASHEHRPAS
jgi:hypothetical protein